MYVRGESHTVEIPLFDGSGDPITSGTVTAEISKDSAAYAATSNSAAHVDDELWTLVLTVAEATCNKYRVKVSHADLPMSIILSDEYPSAAANVVQVGGEDVELDDKTGYKLASDGLDAVAPAELSGPATTWAQKLDQLWRRFFKQAKLNRTTKTIKTYDDLGVELTSQAVDDDGVTQTQGDAT